MRKWINIWLLSLACAFCACDPWVPFGGFRPIETCYEGDVIVRLLPHWEFLGEHPEVMTVLLAKDGDSITHTFVALNVDSFDVKLDAGSYKMLIMNEAYIDYFTMSFINKESYSEIAAESNVYDDLSYIMRKPAVTRSYMATDYRIPPGVVGTAIDSFTITQAQIDSIRHYVPYTEMSTPDTLVMHMRDSIYDMTGKLNLYIRVDNLVSMNAMGASLTGMADGFYLTRAWRKETTAPEWFADWVYERGTAYDITGKTTPGKNDTLDWMVCRSSTFGFPHGKELLTQRNDSDNVLTLYFRLHDQTIIAYKYDLSHYIQYSNPVEKACQTPDSLRMPFIPNARLDMDIVIDEQFNYPVLPYVVDSGKTSEFEVITVQPWEIGEEIEITM